MCNKMGKSKQAAKEKKFDRNVEISAPILDPEIIKAIHSPPKGHRLDIKHGGFKALLSDLNSQDSTDELAPLNDNHIPSYIGISCAVSGYSNYSQYTKQRSSSPNQNQQEPILKTTIKSSTNSAVKFNPNRSRTASPATRSQNQHQEVHHITIDKNNIQSADEERKELTEKLTASATERRRSPSPITPTEDDRHHGAYVGARYCPLPPPSKLVNKHIPLLGIDDDKDPDEFVEDAENKVEHKIASLYGDNFVEDWRESMTHKVKKELAEETPSEDTSTTKSPKDLVKLKPTPVQEVTTTTTTTAQVVEVPNAKVLAGVEKEFLTKLLTDENPPMPKSPSPASSPVHVTNQTVVTTTTSSTRKEEVSLPSSPEKEPQKSQPSSPIQEARDSPIQQEQSAPMSPDSGKSQSFLEEELLIGSGSQPDPQVDHIEYEIRAQSPLDNESSPTKLQAAYQDQTNDLLIEHDDVLTLQKGMEEQVVINQEREENLVNFSPSPEPTEDQAPIEPQAVESEPLPVAEQPDEQQQHESQPDVQEESIVEPASIEGKEDEEKDGRYHLHLLEQEKSFLKEQISRAEKILEEKESELSQETLGALGSAIGKANLLINKKCKQFEELCESNVKSNSSAEKEQYAVLNDDLAGFWDMLQMSLTDVKKSFEALWESNL